MNTIPYLARSTGALGVRAFPASPRLPIGVQSRTDLPVISNRMFISSWMARRAKIVASARLARTP